MNQLFIYFISSGYPLDRQFGSILDLPPLGPKFRREPRSYNFKTPANRFPTIINSTQSTDQFYHARNCRKMMNGSANHDSLLSFSLNFIERFFTMQNRKTFRYVRTNASLDNHYSTSPAGL